MKSILKRNNNKRNIKTRNIKTRNINTRNINTSEINSSKINTNEKNKRLFHIRNRYKKDLYNRNISLMYAISFFQSLILAYVIERLFFEERGMTVQKVVATEIIYSLTIAIFEVPSGILADKIGRKKTLLISGALSVMEFIFLYQAHHFATFAFAIFFAGIGHAARSGCFQAMVYDTLSHNKQQDRFEIIYSRLQIVDTIGTAIAALTGGILAYYFSYELNYLLSIISKLLAFWLTFFLVEPQPIRLSDELSRSESSLRDYISVGMKFLKEQKLVVYYCMVGLTLGSCVNYMDEFWQLLMREIKIPVLFFGVISISFSVCSIPGSMLVPCIKGRIKNKRLFTIVPVFYAASFIVIAFTRNIWALIPMCVLSVLKGIMEPIIEGTIHHNTVSSVRATVESCISLVSRILSIAIGIIFSIFADKDIFLGFLSLGIIIFAGFGINYLIQSKESKKGKNY